MRNSIYFLTTLLIFLLLYIQNSQAVAQTSTNFEIEFDSLEKQHRINGNVLIADKHKIIFESSLGLAEKESQSKNTKEYSFELASISKLFTAVSIMQLKDQGKLSLDDTVKKYLPQFIYPTITIRHLLTHTSGIRDLEMFIPTIKKSPDKILSNADILTTLSESNPPLKSNPGEKWKYNNIGYNLLALVIEKVSGLTYSDYVHKKILTPANMNATCIKSAIETCSNLKIPRSYRFANYYNSNVTSIDTLMTTDFQIKVFRNNLSSLYGSDNFYSTISDLHLFDKALNNNILLSTKSIDEMFTPAVLNNGKLITIKKSGMENTMFGLGWFINEIIGVGKIAWHDGTNPGYETVFLHNITKQQLVIILDNFESEGIQKLSFVLLSQLNNKSASPPPVSLTRIIGQVIYAKGIEEALKTFSIAKSQTDKYYYDENSLNDLGYQFIKAKKLNQALAVFKLNTEEFPVSANAFDSYGEALALSGEREKAIAAYQKVLELDPSNKNAKSTIEKLKQ